MVHSYRHVRRSSTVEEEFHLYAFNSVPNGMHELKTVRVLDTCITTLRQPIAGVL